MAWDCHEAGGLECGGIVAWGPTLKAKLVLGALEAVG